MKIFIFFLTISTFTAILTLSGCVTTKYFPVKGAKTYPPTDSVAVFRSYPDRPYEVLGVVSATSPEKWRLIAKLKEKAMAIGADALVMKSTKEITQEYTSERKTEFSTSRTRYEAVAIKFKTQEGKPIK
jgi:hypothetical protein